MRPAKVTPEKVADGLVMAFRRDGFAGASLGDLKAATGLNPASLYHRFPDGKADMALAALDHAGSAFNTLVIAPLSGNDPPLVRLRKSADGVAAFYDGGTLACLLAVMAMSDAPPAVRQKVRSMFDTWHAALASTLTDAEVADPENRAEDWIATVQGTLVLGRAGLGSGSFARAIKRLEDV